MSIKLIFTVLVLLFSFTVKGQDHERANDFFAKYYQTQNIRRFKGDIIFKENDTILFDKKVLINEFPTVYRSLFKLGILYPEVIDQAIGPIFKEKRKNKKGITLNEAVQSSPMMSADEFQNLVGTDNLTFSAIHQIRYSGSPFVKRFCFWVSRKGLLNPTEYYFEITNKQATSVNDLETFIKGATLSFIGIGSLII